MWSDLCAYYVATYICTYVCGCAVLCCANFTNIVRCITVLAECIVGVSLSTDDDDGGGGHMHTHLRLYTIALILYTKQTCNSWKLESCTPCIHIFHYSAVRSSCLSLCLSLWRCSLASQGPTTSASLAVV